MSTANPPSGPSTKRILAVAKKDFKDAVQSRALWSLVSIFVLLLLATTYAYVELPEMFGPTDQATFGGLLFFTVGITGLFIPLAAIIVCFKSLAGERELGSIKILLSLPVTRSDILFGKLLGRAAVLTTGLAVGLVLGLGFGAVLLGSLDALGLLLFLFATIFFVAVYVSIIVGLSAATGSTTRATTFAVGFFVVFELIWDVVPLGVVYLLNGLSMPTEFPDWVFLIAQLSPSGAYFTSVIALLPDAAADLGVAVSGTGMNVDPVDAEPFYVTPEVGLVALFLWLIVPMLVGYRVFTTADM